MRRVLIVDDNRAFAENLGEILADNGAIVDLAHDGGEALERAAAVRYDVVLTDMQMPTVGGAELVHRLRVLDPGVPAIVISAFTNDDDLAAARREGLLAVLPKPAPVSLLIELVGLARRDGLVVIVEDDATFADTLTELLRSRGFAAVTAGSLLEADHLGPVHPFAALVDQHVPGGPGGVLERVRAKFPGLPILPFSRPFDAAALLDAVEAFAGCTP